MGLTCGNMAKQAGFKRIQSINKLYREREQYKIERDQYKLNLDIINQQKKLSEIDICFDNEIELKYKNLTPILEDSFTTWV